MVEKQVFGSLQFRKVVSYSILQLYFRVSHVVRSNYLNQTTSLKFSIAVVKARVRLCTSHEQNVIQPRLM